MHQEPQALKDLLELQVTQVLQDRKGQQVRLEFREIWVRLEVLESLEPLELMVSLVPQEAQDRLGRRVPQVHPEYLVLLAPQEQLVSLVELV